jgi:hypothetical protein
MTITFGTSTDNNDANYYKVEMWVSFASLGALYDSSLDYFSRDYFYTDTGCPGTSITGPVYPSLLSTSVLVMK